MNTHADKTQENKNQSVANNLPKLKSSGESAFQFADNRPEAVSQRKLKNAINNSPGVKQLKAYQEMANNSPQVKQQRAYQAMADNFTSKIAQRKENLEEEPLQGKLETIQKKENNTGLPDSLKSGVENLSGRLMDDARVHYSPEHPAQMQAHAYAQGTHIQIDAGKEKHLPHEAWHVVQQKQGRVKTTMQKMGTLNVNDDTSLQKEADVMGSRLVASDLVSVPQPKEEGVMHKAYPFKPTAGLAIQRKLIDGWGEYLSDKSIGKLIELFVYRHGEGDITNFKKVIHHHQNQGREISLIQLVDELRGSTEKTWKRVGHLLKLILNQFQDWTGTERDEPAGDIAWDDFGFATKIIRHWVGKYPLLNNPGIDEERVRLLHPQPSKFRVPEEDLANVLTISEDQWQAASVAARRSGWLTGIGFLELRRALDAASNGSIKLQLSRDIIHEGIVDDPKDMVKVGTVSIPQYATTEVALNKAMDFFSFTSFGKSGSYENKFGVILKNLDIGHKLVDDWENMMHRTPGKHVDEKVNFAFLALLSPKKGRQEVIGANGQVLGDGSYMFTIDPSFRIRYMPAANYVGEGGTAKNFFQFIPHSQLASLGAVVAAGNFVISDGKFVWIDNGSGHYRVNPDVNTGNAKAALLNLGYNITMVRFLSRGAGDLDETYRQGNEFLEGLPKGEDRPVMTREIQALQKAMDQMQ